MEFEFDKEIDALLRRARSGEAALAVSSPAAAGGLPAAHLDADDISAFAENALPEKTKKLYMAHLADCPRCRQILSNIIALNAEAESQAASSAVTVPEKLLTVAGAEIPWYRKLFIFPQLTYAMGGLVLIFSGFLVYFVLQSGRNTSDSSISQMKEWPQGTGAANSSSAAHPAETSQYNSNSAAKASNAATMPSTAATNTAANAAGPSTMSNAASNTNIPEARKELSDRDRAPEATPEPVPAAPPPPPPATMSENQTAAGSAKPRPSLVQNQPVTAPDDVKSKVAASPRAEAKSDKRSDDELELAGRATKSPLKPAEKKAEIESRQSGGRNFTRKNGVWYDDNYKGQSTTNVSRNSDDYKKLDGGLRSIAAGFGGTVVIVWNGKAYRIQ